MGNLYLRHTVPYAGARSSWGAKGAMGGQGTSALLETPCPQSSLQTPVQNTALLLRQAGKGRKLNSGLGVNQGSVAWFEYRRVNLKGE